AAHLSAERVKQAPIAIWSDRWTARARTSDHQPMPSTATRNFSALICSVLRPLLRATAASEVPARAGASRSAWLSIESVSPSFRRGCRLEDRRPAGDLRLQELFEILRTALLLGRHRSAEADQLGRDRRIVER